MNNNNTELFWSSRKHIQLVLFYDWGSQGQITEVLCWQTCGNAGSESRCLECHHPRPLPTASQLWHFLIVCLLGEVFHTSLGNQWYEVLSVASTETQVCLTEQFIGRCFVAWTVFAHPWSSALGMQYKADNAEIFLHAGGFSEETEHVPSSPDLGNGQMWSVVSDLS